jgi:hypothetical protein
MSKEIVYIHQKFDVPAEKVWSFFNDHNRMSEILPAKVRRIVDSKDKENVNGIGAVRRIELPILPVEETVVRSIKPTLIEYTITKGSPLKHHFGTINIIPDGDKACILDYTIELESDNFVLTTIMKHALEFAIGNGVKKLVKQFKNNPNYA